MTVRVKILAISAVLLLLFAVVLVSSVIMQEHSSRKVAAIIDYHLPLAATIADLDVATDKYELIVERLLREPDRSSTGAAAERGQLAKTRERIAADFDGAAAILGRALSDPRTDGNDRLVFAKVQRSLEYLKRYEEPFLALGGQVEAAYDAGKLADATALSRQFDKYEQAFGPDMAALRSELVALARVSTEHTYEQQTRILRLNVVLFAVAVVIGLGLSAMGARRLVEALWRVVDGAKAIEAGNLAVQVPVTSRDEIGQLAEAFNRMAEELRTKERIKDTFGKYVDPRVATILFSDLKGFTAISEQLTASAMVRLLNRYFTVVAEQIRAHNGVLEKYIGDAVMAFWAPPFSTGDDHAASACLAALAHREAVAALRPELPDLLGLRRNVPELTVRMGLATGEVVVGTVGAPTAKSFAAIGDITNLASRLEGVNKVYGTSVILAEETYRLAQTVVEARELDTVVVMGKSEPVRIYELIGRAHEVDAGLLQLRELYTEGLQAYRRRDWGGAGQCFAKCLELMPGDGPSAVLRNRSAMFAATPPPPDWDGVWHLAEK